MTAYKVLHETRCLSPALTLLVGILCTFMLTGYIQTADCAGFTMIVHGHSLDSDPEFPWIEGMRDAIAMQVLGSPAYAVYANIELVGDGVSEPFSIDVVQDDISTSGSGEILAVLDWSAGLDSSTPEVASAVAVGLIDWGYTELPIHLIGHSRGASLIAETARQLGERGVWVDQVTTFDPHPVTGYGYDDAPMDTYYNTLFADNYWRADGCDIYKDDSDCRTDPDGEYITGAYNRELTEFGEESDSDDLGYPSEHSDVHLWYHGTIDLNTPAYDGSVNITQRIRQAWWTDYENQGANAGYLYSRLVGGNRLADDAPVAGGDFVSDGYHNHFELGGYGARTALDMANAVWPNIVTFDIRQAGIPLGRGINMVTAGDTLSFNYTCQDYDSTSYVEIFLDTDPNPYNGYGSSIYYNEHSATGTAVLSQEADWDTSAMSTDMAWYVLATISDSNGHIRYLYADQLVSFTEPDDDNYEQNDSAPESYDLSGQEGVWLHSVDGLGLQLDDDWYEIYVAPCYERLVVDCQFVHADGNVDLALYDSAGSQLIGSASSDDDEYIDYTVPTAGTVYIRVHGDNAGTSYDIWWLSSTSVPNAPAEVTATQGDFSDRIEIAWSGSSCADDYMVYRNTVDDADSAVPLGEWQSGTNLTDDTALAETVYYYWVTSRNVSGSSGFSVVATGWVFEQPTSITVTSVSPRIGMAGQELTIAGVNFEPGATVMFDEVPASVLSGTDTEIVVQIPAGTGTVDVQVTNPGSGMSDTVVDGFTYGRDPDVDGSGTLDASDVQVVINSALQVQACPSCDLDNNGSVDAIDVQLIINAVLGIGW